MKKIIISVCSTVAAGTILAGVMFTSTAFTEKKSIGSQAALEIALSDAGVKKENATAVKSEFDKENGKYVFDVEFESDGKEYDYYIDAKSGDIIERDVDKEYVALTEATPETTKAEVTSSNATKSETSNTQTKTITLDEAKKIALKNAGIDSSDASFTKAKLDKSDNKYEIEFITTNMEYDYDIDADSGEILEKEIEKLKSSTSQTTTKTESKSKITLTEAKKIATSDANLSSDKCSFTKAKLDYDDGAYEYEIEFVCSTQKYDYTIDAYTGTITEKEVKKITTLANTNSESKVSISGVEDAKKYALDDANVKASDAKFTKAEYDSKDNEYEIEFVANNKEYDYEIKKNGVIVEKDVKTVKDTTLYTAALITTDKARSIALDHAGFKLSDVTMKKVELDKDNGVYEYEVEFVNGKFEYEYTINAKTGDIIEFDKEFDN